jgi:hypothetical protein
MQMLNKVFVKKGKRNFRANQEFRLERVGHVKLPLAAAKPEAVNLNLICKAPW